LLRIILRVLLVVAAAMALIVSLMLRLVLPITIAATLRVIGKCLRTHTDTQQTNTGQTPDARLHAFPHCGLGLVRKT
jgi:hypothetical protein